MIPQRIELKGFLCYQDGQEVRFDGAATLWMLSGLNGSGKSSIFDAVTYALFGHHRGGGQHALELINKDSEALLVEFDFLLDGRLYRAKRTLRRNTRGGATGTQQIFRREGDNGDGKWAPIEGTGQKREFDAWVADHVGLNYETFTSSVLLLQGKADKLLDSKPEGRREVLAGIVDLERYEKLHRTADEKRKLLEGELKGLNNRLNAVPVVEPLALAEAAGCIEEAEEARGRARAAVERLLGLEARRGSGSICWAGWRTPGSAGGRRSGCWRTRPTSRRTWRGWPSCARCCRGCRGSRSSARGHKAEEKVKEWTKQRQKHAEELERRAHALDLARDRKTSTQRLIDADAARQRDVSGQLRRRSVQLEKLKEHERHEGDLERLREEMKRLPDDPAAAVGRAREAFEALTALAQTVPLLGRLASRRDELRQARRARTGGAAGPGGGRGERDSDQGGPGNDPAALAVGGGDVAPGRRPGGGGANRRAAGARLAQGIDAAGRLESLPPLRPGVDGGPPPGGETPPHHGRRGGRGEAQAGDASTPGGAAVRAASAGGTRPGGSRPAGFARRVPGAQGEGRTSSGGRGAAAGGVRPDLRRTGGGLACASPRRCRPTGRRRSTPRRPPWPRCGPRRPACRRGAEPLQQAEQVRDQWHKWTTQEAAKLQELTRLRKELPNDPQEVRREHARLEAEEKSLEKNLAARRLEWKEVEADMERLTKEREQRNPTWASATPR